MFLARARTQELSLDCPVLELSTASYFTGCADTFCCCHVDSAAARHPVLDCYVLPDCADSCCCSSLELRLPRTTVCADSICCCAALSGRVCCSTLSSRLPRASQTVQTPAAARLSCSDCLVLLTVQTRSAAAWLPRLLLGRADSLRLPRTTGCAVRSVAARPPRLLLGRADFALGNVRPPLAASADRHSALDCHVLPGLCGHLLLHDSRAPTAPCCWLRRLDLLLHGCLGCCSAVQTCLAAVRLSTAPN